MTSLSKYINPLSVPPKKQKIAMLDIASNGTCIRAVSLSCQASDIHFLCKKIIIKTCIMKHPILWYLQ